ncbi:hypothetical protein F7230_05810 [Corynebacterium sp. 320]|uniref:hypothetical protein n=1 Tax=Corynebacterium TaxID=1716 RepID=UPI00125CD30D|nr:MULTISPECIES: hypothetical protein [Corynebacterium]KAB1503058.1 hypothetical protein F7230_05810 [Corynebacterium sp. 320]KAB1550731.1 hypothetical protein F7233_09385 [Corynebacterium sp. 321]KAB1551090.1 hypothetical protein F7232_08555 [Corynebacterium sp. 319]KAB3526855.1 hypothetical protein F8354_05810 [Corynebacterium sp. 250]KAB3538348.1 hypothetical protein F8390_08710 [Corynebacterium sp. 366]
MSENTTTASGASGASESSGAGAFDLRNVIGALLGLYGLILLCAFFLVDPGVDVTTNEPKVAEYNLWAGVALVVAAVVFFLWAKLNPITVQPVPEESTPAESEQPA